MDLSIRYYFNKLFQRRLILFLLVCGINTIFGYGLFALLVYCKMHYSLAVLLATIAGILFNFKTIGGIVFQNKNNGLLLRFAAVYAIGYLCNTGGIMLMGLGGVNAYYAGAILTLPVALLTFFLNKKFVFRK